MIIERILHDVRDAVRTIGRNSRSAALAVLTLALGAGAAAAVFTVADPLLFQRLPVHEPPCADDDLPAA